MSSNLNIHEWSGSGMRIMTKSSSLSTQTPDANRNNARRAKTRNKLVAWQPLVLFLIFSTWQFQQTTATNPSLLSTEDLANLEVHKHMSPSELQRVFQVDDHAEVPEYEVVQIHSVQRSRRDQENVRSVRLQTQSHGLQLRLARQQHLVRKDRTVPAWYADSITDNVTYTAMPKDDEEIGDVYQDRENQAALLLYKDREDQALLMDGTIGDDLVIKPISAQARRDLLSHQQLRRKQQQQQQQQQQQSQQQKVVRKHPSLLGEHMNAMLNRRVHGHKRTDENDDYAFLDEDEDMEDEDVIGVGNFNSLGMKWRQKREAEQEELEVEDVRADLHIIYKRRDTHTDHNNDYHFMEADTFPTKSPESHSRRKRQAPYIIFPEILCIVDYDGYRLHGKDNIAIKRYVISFWNGIDLRYKLLKGPSVKISIAGIIISRGRDATPYLERNRVGRDAIDSASALTDMGKYLFLERRLPVYDIAVAITKLDMCRRKSRIGECNRGTAGFAYVGGACVVNKRLEKVNSVAIVEDTGGFSGIIVAAHELGHLLGAVHDGSPPPSYLGGPGARKCRWEDGFIMSDLRHTSKGFRWSHCTVNQFHHFLNGETATCMYNSPHEEESLPRVLPGKLLSLDAQCRKDRGTSACFKDDRVCAQLFCFDAGSGYCVSYRPAAEGSRCGDGFICLNGKCVPEHENEVDYTGEDILFLRRSGHTDPVYAEVPKKKDRRKWWSSLVSDPTTTVRPSSKKATTTAITTSSSSSTTTTTTTTISTSTYEPWWKRIRRNHFNTLSNPSNGKTSSKKARNLETTPSPQSTTTETTTSSTPRTFKPTSIPSSFKDKSHQKSLDIETVVSKPSNNRAITLDKSASGEFDTCEDRIKNIAGSMTCRSFLRSFAYQYCRHKYIKRNCCASHEQFCNGSRPKPGKRK